MAEALTKQETIDELVKEAKKLNKLELQILLTRLKVAKLVKTKRKPVANYDSRKIKPPTLKQIDRWKHEARTYAQK